MLVRGLRLWFCISLLRTVDRQSITPAFWKCLVNLQTCLLGLIFTAFMICLSSTTAVFSADQVVVCRWWFPNSWFLHALCFCCSSNWLHLFFKHPHYLLFSQSLLPHLHPGLCVIIECRSNGYNWYNTFPAFNIWIINEQDTADHSERPVRKLSQYFCSHQIEG